MIDVIIASVIAFFAGGTVMRLVEHNEFRKIEKLNKKARAFEKQKRKELIDAANARVNTEREFRGARILSDLAKMQLDKISESYGEVVKQGNLLKAASLSMREDLTEIKESRGSQTRERVNECAALLNTEEYERLIKGLV